MQGNEVGSVDGTFGKFLGGADVDKNSVPAVGELLAEFVGSDFLVGRVHGTAMAFVAQGFKAGIVSAEDAVRIFSELDSAEGTAQGVVASEFAEWRFANLEEDFEGFHCLQGSDDAGEGPEHSGFGAIGDGVGGGGVGKEAAVAGAFLGGVEDGDLAVELKDGAVDEGLFEKEGGVVAEVAGGEVVGAVEDEVVVFGEFEGVFDGEADGVLFDDPSRD